MLLLALTLGIHLVTAAKPALVDESDCGHAIAARELRESGDWAVLHINGIRMGEEEFAQGWSVGGEMTLEQVIAYALDGIEETSLPNPAEPDYKTYTNEYTHQGGIEWQTRKF